jgi:hypothetical protein
MPPPTDSSVASFSESPSRRPIHTPKTSAANVLTTTTGERRAADAHDLAEREAEPEPRHRPAQHRPLRHAHTGAGPMPGSADHRAQRHSQQDHQQQRGHVQRVLHERLVRQQERRAGERGAQEESGEPLGRALHAV